MKKQRLFSSMLALGLLLALAVSVTLAQEPGPRAGLAPQAALGTGFTYQGRLTDGGSPANGDYDLEFKLYDDPDTGAQVGGAISIDDYTVSEGLFTVQLDFGDGAFKGDGRWLEIGVRPGAEIGAYTTLTPRQPLTPSPYALALPGLWTQQNVTSPNLIGGYSGNDVTGGAVGATIGGGGASGSINHVTADYATIGGGEGNEAGGNYATVPGGSGNTVSGGYATIGGGLSNVVTATATYATVGGGYSNDVANEYATASGGGLNEANGFAATIGGGYHNEAIGYIATVGGGTGNKAIGNYATAGGGYGNVVTDTYATIGGGRYNQATAAYATIGGGGGDSSTAANCVTDDYGTVGGGYYNRAGDANGITGDARYATVAGGDGNRASDEFATVGGGTHNTADGNAATVGGGYNSEASGQAATVGGGANNEASDDYATVPGGKNAAATHYGQMAYASGSFASTGDAQASLYVVRNTTTNAIPTELFLDGSDDRITIDSDRTLVFDILVTGRSDNGDSAGYQIYGVIENVVGTTQFVGSTTKTTLGEDIGAWDAIAMAYDNHDALGVVVTGFAGTNIRWVATVRTVEVAW